MSLQRPWLVSGTVVVLLAAAAAVSHLAESARNDEFENDIRYLPGVELLHVASFGFDDLTADALWFRLVLYYGESRSGEHELDFFHQLASSVVELDPNFLEGYRFPALVMSQDMEDPDAGIDMLQRGMRAMPNEWWLPFEIGFIEYVTRFDDAEAYRWFKRAAEVPGAPEFPRRFAAFVASRAGDLQVSLVLYKMLAETTSNEHLQEDAIKKVDELEAAIAGTGPVPEWARRRRSINGRSEG